MLTRSVVAETAAAGVVPDTTTNKPEERSEIAVPSTTTRPIRGPRPATHERRLSTVSPPVSSKDERSTRADIGPPGYPPNNVPAAPAPETNSGGARDAK